MTNSLNLFADAMGASAQITAGTLRAGGLELEAFAAVQDVSLAAASSAPTLFSRVCAPEHRWLSGWFARHGGRYAYFLDDNLWAYDEGELGAWLSRPSVHRTLDSYIRNAALVVVNSMPLKDVVDARFPERRGATYIPPAFDFSLLPAVAQVREGDHVFRVGFAGTAREKAFEKLVQAIIRIVNRPGNDIAFEFIGYLPPALGPLAGAGRVHHFPEIADYRAFIAFKASRGWQVGLAPIHDDAFTACKTNNKYREYSALGIAGLYADSALYRSSVQEGVDGLLVPDTVEGWEAAILALRADTNARARMAANAFSRVRRQHDIGHVAALWRAALDVSSLRPPRSATAHADWALRARVARERERLEAYRRLVGKSGWPALVAHLARRTREHVNPRR